MLLMYNIYIVYIIYNPFRQFNLVDYNQAGRQRGFEGVERTPPLLTSKRFYTSKLHILLSSLPFESDPLVSLLLRITAV